MTMGETNQLIFIIIFDSIDSCDFAALAAPADTAKQRIINMSIRHSMADTAVVVAPAEAVAVTKAKIMHWQCPV